MRKLFLTVVLIFAFGTMAMASDIAFYVGATPGGAYDEATMNDDVAKMISETGHLFNDVQQFADDNLEGLGQWVDANTGDGELDIIWLNGAIPSTIYPTFNEMPDGSRAEEWLDDGNMFINVADWFAYATFENGEKERNETAGAANILDHPADIIAGSDGLQLPVTDTGKEFIPSLGDQSGTNRPVDLDAIEEPWEAAAIFAQDGNLADPVVLHNMDTGGYLAIVNQGWGDNFIDRGAACAELIGNWLFAEVITTPVEPADKLATTWGREKTGY